MLSSAETLLPRRYRDMRVVLEHTTGYMKGIHSIVGVKEEGQELPEILDATALIDNPRMRTPGPVSLVAVKRSYVLYRQIYAPTQMQGRAMPGAPFDERQQ